MVQVVGHFENNITFEAPFVICNVGGSFRIECEIKGHRTSALAHLSIYRMLTCEMNYEPGCTHDFGLREREVNWLNAQVEIGRIVLKDDQWEAIGYS